MADTPYTFRESGARRIVAAVRRIEGTPTPDIAGPAGGAAARDYASRFVKVTITASAALGKYTGKLLSANYSSGSAILLNFYNLSEAAGRDVGLDVDDFVSLVRVDREILGTILGITVAEGDNWVANRSKYPWTTGLTITGHSVVSTNKWTYAGTLDDGTSITGAINGAELPNSGSGEQGNGVDVPGSLGVTTMRPVTTGTRWPCLVTKVAGTKAYLIGVPNGGTVAC